MVTIRYRKFCVTEVHMEWDAVSLGWSPVIEIIEEGVKAIKHVAMYIS